MSGAPTTSKAIRGLTGAVLVLLFFFFFFEFFGYRVNHCHVLSFGPYAILPYTQGKE